MSRTETAVEREQIEDLLYYEADLLDNWQLHEWEALFTDDGRYYVHGTNVAVDSTPVQTLFYIGDDRIRIRERVRRLGKRGAWAEFPRSRTCHLVSNIRLGEVSDDEITASCKFVVHRWRDRVDTFFGSAHYRLVVDESGGIHIREKRCVINSDNLHSQGLISIIL